MADGEEDRRFGQRMHGHVQQAGEIGERAAHAEGEGDDAHVLDRRIGEHALDVAAAVQHERREHEREQSERHHQRAGRKRTGIRRQQHLEAQQRVERDIEQQARQHRRDRRRALGVRVGQPGMQRREADLGAVAEQQKDEGDIEQRRVEGAGAADEHGPHHGVETFADDRPRRHVDQDGAEQSERDADAAENEILPRRFERLVGAVNADHQHRGQGGELDRHPHQADIVGDERKIHREHQHLIHGVIEAHEGRRQPADFELMADIARAEDAGGEADERREHDERAVEIVDEKIRAGRRLGEQQRERADQGQRRRQHVEPRGCPITGQEREQRGGERREPEHAGHGLNATPSKVIGVLRGSGRAPGRRPCRSVRGCGTGKCRSR